MPALPFTLPRQVLFDDNGDPVPGGKVNFYVGGTLTRQDTYTTKALSVAHDNPVIADAAGELAAIYLDADKTYRVIATDSNDVTLYDEDNVNDVDFRAPFYDTTSAESAAGVTPVNFNKKPGDVLRYGTNTTPGTTDMRASIQAAIDVAQVSGGLVTFPTGDYLINSVSSSDSYANGLVIGFNNASGDPHNIDNRVKLIFSRGARLLAGDNNMMVLRMSDNYTTVVDPIVSGNAKTGVVGVGLVPEDMTQTTTRVDQRFNGIYRPFVQDCAEGIILQCGPDVGGLDSGCWYNKIIDPHFHQTTRGIWLKDGPNTSSAGCNRNFFRGVRIGNSVNTGVQIDSGDTNTFFGVALEGVSSGTSPNTTPTGIVVKASGTHSGDNNHNMFHGAAFESCTRDMEIANSTTVVNGSNVAGSKVLFTATPAQLHGTDPSVQPQISHAGKVIYQGNSHLSGIPLNTLTIVGRGIALHDNTEGFFEAYDEGHTWASFVLSTGNVTNAAAVVEPVSFFKRFGRFVDWHFKFRIQASVAGTSVVIDLPEPASDTVYEDGSTIDSMTFPLFVLAAGAAWEVTRAFFTPDADTLTVVAPSSGWVTASSTSEIHAMLRYRAN